MLRVHHTPAGGSPGRERFRTPAIVEPVLSEPSGLDLAIELAHDVRSPLSAVVSLAELLQSGAFGPVNDAQRHQLQLMQQAARGIGQLAGDVVEYGRVDAVGIDEPIAPFNPGDILSAVGAIVQPIAERSALQLRVRNHAGTRWLGRRVALTRVLLNLTNHAIRYSASGIVEFGARQPVPELLEFYVRDPGTGEPDSGGTTQPDEGNAWTIARPGLGLIICRRLIKAMGSTLSVESQPAGASRISFAISRPVHG